jgi:hypothetical protein
MILVNRPSFGTTLLMGMLATALAGGHLRGEELGAATRTSRTAEIESRLGTDMAYLAGDELQGRDVGSEGLELAARYIAKSFEQEGLQIDLFDGTPFQTFKIPMGVTIGEAAKNRLVVRSGDGEGDVTEVPLGTSFRPMGVGDSGTAEGPVVFVGYGITAPEKSYDDYESVDVKGAIVLMVRKEPRGPEADKVFGGDSNSRHAYFDTKIRNAAERGATAVLLVNDEGSIARMTQRVDQQISAEAKLIENLDLQIADLPKEADNTRRRLSTRREEILAMIEDLKRQKAVAAEGLMEVVEAGGKPTVEGIPVLSISRSLASGWIESASGKTLEIIQREIDDTVRPRSIELKLAAKIQTSLSPSSVSTSNVIGVLPGRGRLADETVVIGAHYDHVGMGGIGSLAPGTVAIHNGADDNASGTSVLLRSVARVKESLANRPDHRRVVFIAFTGEERGLLGSEHYVRNPRFLLESTVAMINLDMVGRLRNNDLTVYGTGTAAGFDELVDRANRDTRFALFKIASGYGPSDHQSFYMQKVPVLFFFTGLHSDYHRPSDKIDKINLNGMARITDITSVVASELAIADQRPAYATTDRDVQIRQQSKAYLGVSLQEPTDRPEPQGDKGNPGDIGNPGGAVVSAVSAGSPADMAGIRLGDRLVRIDSIPIRSVADLIDHVGDSEIDAVVKIELVRGGQSIEISARLQRRPGD